MAYDLNVGDQEEQSGHDCPRCGIMTVRQENNPFHKGKYSTFGSNGSFALLCADCTSWLLRCLSDGTSFEQVVREMNMYKKSQK